MVVDIFYPLLTLKITILACFIQKKSGDLPPPPPRPSPGTPWWAYSSLPYPQLQKKNNAPIFFSRLAPNKHKINVNGSTNIQC